MERASNKQNIMRLKIGDMVVCVHGTEHYKQLTIGKIYKILDVDYFILPSGKKKNLSIPWIITQIVIRIIQRRFLYH